jgi:hypothetical protein
MSLEDYKKFKGVSHIGNDHVSNTLETNMKMFFDTGFLKIGGWQDIDIPLSGAYGGDFSTLRLVDDDLYTDGQVWESVRKDWVYESGVEYADVTGGSHGPNVVGTPTIDDVAATGTYSVCYPLGRIIFDEAISTSSTVKIQHAFRNVQVYRADDAPWWNQIQTRSYRVDNSHMSQTGSGAWSILSNNRVQLPCVVLEVVPRGSSRPYELGNGVMEVQRDMLFHIVAETRNMRNNLMDFIAQQTDKTIWLLDTNDVAEADAFPLNMDGAIATGGMSYDELVDVEDYRYRKCYMEESYISEVQTLDANLYEATVRTSMQVIV